MTPVSSEDREMADDRFLANCLKAYHKGQNKIDMSAVAQAMGYANPKSAGNRWAALKKKHVIDLDAFYAPNTAGAKVAKPAGGASKAQGTKRTPKKSAAKGPKKGPAQQSDDVETPADQPADEATADEA